MSASHSKKVLQLYRQLLKYGNQLQYTNQNYFKNRIRTEFRQHKELESPTEIEFEVKVRANNFSSMEFEPLFDFFMCVISFQRAEALLNKSTVI